MLGEMLGNALRQVARRSWFGPVVVYLVVTSVYLAMAPGRVLGEHTPYNHFALMAEGWLRGQLALPGAPPAYAHGNDFALFSGRWYVVFPPLPSLLVLPWVAWVGRAELVRDGLFFLLLSGLAPAGFYALLTRAEQLELIPSSRVSRLGLTAAYAFGSVYFFTALEGTVWFASHVVAALVTVLYLRASLGAARPLSAGLWLGCAMATRGQLVLLAIFFLGEAFRVSGGAERRDWRRLLARVAWFALPVSLFFAALLWHNFARFGDPWESGYRYLSIAWRPRIEKWGLFDYHYLARNLGVMLSSLPYLTQKGAAAPWQVSGHGLALWFTTPLYLLLLRRRSDSPLWSGALVTAILVAIPSLLYQNTGWLQFGQRFSNDYAPVLFLLLATHRLRPTPAVVLLFAWGILVNGFGAYTFGRPEYREYYYIEPSQRVIYQPD
jgi:hypothetical protein